LILSSVETSVEAFAAIAKERFNVVAAVSAKTKKGDKRRIRI